MKVIIFVSLVFCALQVNSQTTCTLFRRFRGLCGGATTPATTTCPSISLSNGRTACTNGRARGSRCSVYCNNGCNRIGSSASTCISRGSSAVWSPSVATCNCPAIGRCPSVSISNGNSNCNNGRNIGSRCTFTCDSGCRRSGTSSSTCLSGISGRQPNWFPSIATCTQSRQCPFVSIAYGNARCNGRTVGSTCQFTCNNGYAINGDESSTCVQSGCSASWAPDVPTCQPLCPTVNFRNGVFDCDDDRNVGSDCTFTCNAGYILSGRRTSTCQSRRNGISAAWSPSIPTCNARSCPTVRIGNGNANCNGRSFKSRCTFSCRTGYNLSGSRTSTCNQNGNWSPSLPTCARRTTTTTTTATTTTAQQDPVDPDGETCNGLSRKWGKCSPITGMRTSMDDCDEITETCSTGRLLADTMASSFVAPAMNNKPAQAQSVSGGIAARTLTTNSGGAPPPAAGDADTEQNCIYIRDSDDNIISGNCNPSSSSANNGKRKKRQIIQTKRDLVFVFDESGSIGSTRYEKVKRIASAIVRLLCDSISLHPEQTRVAVISFDRHTHFHIPFLNYTNLRLSLDSEYLAQYIFTQIMYGDSYYNHLRTCMLNALEDVYNVVFDPNNGARTGDYDVEQDIIIITDGCENCRQSSAVVTRRIKNTTDFFISQGVHVYVIGIGLRERCKVALSLLAQGGRCFHFFYLTDWDFDVNDFVDELENPPGDLCLNVFENPSGECLAQLG